MIPLRLYAYAAAGLALIGGVLWFGNRQYKAGADVGRSQVRALWEADTKARDAADAAIRAENAAKEATARKAGQEIADEYQAKVIAAVSDRDGVYRLLQSARGQVRSCSSARATDSLIAATTREADIAERVDRAVAGVVTEARANADQLDALIAVVKPQLH